MWVLTTAVNNIILFRFHVATRGAFLRLNLANKAHPMSLTKEQQKELRRLSKELSEIERLSVENNIDLDVFISEYSEEGYSVYATERVNLAGKASSRKDVFRTASGKDKQAHKAAKTK
ncbi:MAG: hypothetical protein RL213_1187 [Bacteroidota bacterium]